MKESRQQLLKRIVIVPDVCGGKPIIRGYRMAVEHVLDMLAAGSSYEELLENYDWLEYEDILACMAFAYESVADTLYFPEFVEKESVIQ